MRFFNVKDMSCSAVLACSSHAIAQNQTVNQTIDQAIELPNKSYILPTAIAMWPPVWWSWLVLLAVLISILGIGFFFVQRYRNNAYRREAVKLLHDTQKLTDIELLTLCHQTIRRCLITNNRHDLASMTNHDLFPQLDKSIKDKQSFAQLGTHFITGAYQPTLQLSEAERETFLQTTIQWCRRHNA